MNKLFSNSISEPGFFFKSITSVTPLTVCVNVNLVLDPLKYTEKNEDELKLGNEITISSIVFKDQCLSGFAGLLYWEFYAKKMGYKNHNISLGKIQEDTGGYIIQIPVDSHGISVYSDNVIQLRDELVKKYDIKEEHQYNRFLDKLPHKFILNNVYELFDNKGYMLSAYKTINNIFIANLQNIMLYMLTNLIILTEINSINNRGYSFYIGYITAQSIVKWAVDEYKKSPAKKYMPFLPSTEIYGTTEVSDSYINSKRQFLEKIHNKEKVKLGDLLPLNWLEKEGWKI